MPEEYVIAQIMHYFCLPYEIALSFYKAMDNSGNLSDFLISLSGGKYER